MTDIDLKDLRILAGVERLHSLSSLVDELGMA